MPEEWLPNEILKHALEDGLDLTLDPEDVPRLPLKPQKQLLVLHIRR